MTRNTDTQTVEMIAERLVRQEVRACVSSLVATLAENCSAITWASPCLPSMDSLAEQARELASPVLDYEDAAREAGWTKCEMGRARFINDAANDTSGSKDWEALCSEQYIDPTEREVFEHWIVSDWLGEKLAERGEKVDSDFSGLTIWARTTTGQAIHADPAFVAIAAEMQAQ